MIPLTAAAASDAVGSDIQNIEGLVNELSTGLHIPELVISLILTVVAFIAAKIISFVIRKGFKRLAGKDNKFTPLMASLMWRICSVLVWIVAILSILAFWGIDLTPVLAGLGVTGIVLGFALQESISSLFSGIMIAINNPFRVGDWVEIGQDGVAGTVKAMDMMCVTLSTADNKKYTVSNKYVWNNTILNYSYIEKRRIDMSIDVGYDMDTDKAKSVLLSLIRSYPEVLPDPEPIVEVNAYGASGITIIVRPWVSPADYWKVYWRFNGDVLRILRDNQLDMPFSQIVVHMAKDE